MATRARRPDPDPGRPVEVDQPPPDPPAAVALAPAQAELPAQAVPPARPPAPAVPAAFVRAKVRLVTPSGALAHVAGDLVPAQNVTRNGWSGLVEPVE